MPPPLAARTRRATVVFFAEDVELLERRYGHGWTEQVRRLVHEDCKQYRIYKRTLEEVYRDGD